MGSTGELELAEEILQRTGFLPHRVTLVDAVETELYTIYSELDAGLPSRAEKDPASYGATVQTIVDLVSNREIYRTFYMLQNRSERSFLRRLAQNEDLYVKVLRGKKTDYSQYWYFNFPTRKNESESRWEGYFSFTLRVGVRDTYPFELKIRDHLPEAEFNKFLSLVRSS